MKPSAAKEGQIKSFPLHVYKDMFFFDCHFFVIFHLFTEIPIISIWLKTLSLSM